MNKTIRWAALAAALTIISCTKMIDPVPMVKVKLPPPAPAGGIVDIKPVTNPDRGWHNEKIYFTHQTILTDRAPVDYEKESEFIISRIEGAYGYDNSTKLIQLYLYNTEYSGKDIPQSAMDNMQKCFDILRDSGYKCILRFAYNKGMHADNGWDDPATIRRHMVQLRPLIEKNRGYISALQAGFIGAWGEWHSSTITNNDWDIRNDVVNFCLDVIPEPWPVQIRYIDEKDVIVYNNPSQKYRVGIHDDFFTAGSSVTDHNAVPGPLYDYMTEGSKHYYVSGEMPYEGDEYGLDVLIDLNKAMTILRDHHFTTFDITQNYELNFANWKIQKVYPALLEANGIAYDEEYFKEGDKIVNRSFYSYVRDHLGYRYNVKAAAAEYESGTVKASVSINNAGFAAMMVPHKVSLAVLDGNGTEVASAPINVNPMDWQPTIDPFEINGEVSCNLPAGSYDVAIRIQDEILQDVSGYYDVIFVPGDKCTVFETPDGKRRYSVISTLEVK